MSYTFESTDPQSFTGVCFFSYCHRDYSVETELTYTNGQIFFPDEHLNPISISSIEEVSAERGTLTLKGAFFQDNQIVHELKIYLNKFVTEKKLLEVIDKTIELTTGKLVLTNGEMFQEFEVQIKKVGLKISVIEISTKKVFLVFDHNDILYRSNNVLLTFNKQGHPYYLIFNVEPIPFILSNFNIVKNSYYHSFTQLHGSFNKLRIQGSNVGLMVNAKDIYIFLDYYQVYSFSHHQLKIGYQHKDGSTTFQFTASTGELSYITFTKIPESFKEILPSVEIDLDQFVAVDQEPYTLSFEKKGWNFYQSKDIQFLIPFTQLSSIEVLDNSQEDKVAVTFHVTWEIGKISFWTQESILPEIIKTTFREKKLPLLKGATTTDLYSSWSRQINDFLVYNLFGQLKILQNGIKEIQDRKNITKYQKYKKILNFMYHVIREQRRTLDRVSVQFPQLLMQEEIQFLNAQCEESFEQFQRQLLSITNQIQRHMAEIENSLNALSYEIIPRDRIETPNKEQSKTNYWGAAILGGLGILTGGVGWIATGALLGLRTYATSKDSVNRQQVLEENDQHKLEFYINKALDSFEHFMESMLPFYISLVSKSYYSLTRKNAKLLILQNDNEKWKQAIFNRLVELYTAKQLPLRQGDKLTSGTIIEMLMTPAKVNEGSLIATLSE